MTSAHKQTQLRMKFTTTRGLVLNMTLDIGLSKKKKDLWDKYTHTWKPLRFFFPVTSGDTEYKWTYTVKEHRSSPPPLPRA